MANTAMLQNGVVYGVFSAPDHLEEPAFEGDARTIDERMTDYFNGLGLPGEALQTSYNGNIRGRFAGIGDIHSEEFDIFASPAPAPDYTLNADGTWSPPPAPAGEGWVIPDGATAWHLDINAADVTALDELEGVGPTLAASIIAAAPFADMTDLAARVDGVSTTMTENWPAFV